MSDRLPRARSAGPDLVRDGPPLPAVLLVFVALCALAWGPANPALGMALLALGALGLAVAHLRSARDWEVEERHPPSFGRRFAPVPRPRPPERPRRCP